MKMMDDPFYNFEQPLHCHVPAPRGPGEYGTVRTYGGLLVTGGGMKEYELFDLKKSFYSNS